VTKQTSITPADRVEIAYDPDGGVPVVDTTNRGTVIVTLVRRAG
jgi:hypothetical protein